MHSAPQHSRNPFEAQCDTTVQLDSQFPRSLPRQSLLESHVLSTRHHSTERMESLLNQNASHCQEQYFLVNQEINCHCVATTSLGCQNYCHQRYSYPSIQQPINQYLMNLKHSSLFCYPIASLCQYSESSKVQKLILRASREAFFQKKKGSNFDSSFYLLLPSPQQFLPRLIWHPKLPIRQGL